MINGAFASPAPRRTPVTTIDAAKSGSANATMRSTCAPSAITSGSVEKIEMSCGARKNSPAPASVIIIMPMYVVIRLNRSARSFRFAPSACPTSVVPAEATPNAGM